MHRFQNNVQFIIQFCTFESVWLHSVRI
jgi:hypothetical protein